MNKKLFNLASANHIEQFQIMKITQEEVNIETLNDKINKFVTSNVDKYIVSGIYQDKEVRLYTENLEDNIIEKLIEQAKYLDITTSKTRSKLENIKETTTYQIQSLDNITKRMLNLNNLKSHYHNLKEINAYYNETIIERTITTEENELYDIKKEKSFAIEVLLTEKEKKSTAYDSRCNIDDSDIDIESITEETIQNAIDKLNFKEIKNGTYKVILTSKVMGNILNKFYHLFTADSIQKDISLLVGKKETQVFSDKITIIEDPNNPKLLGKRLFDDTGKITRYKEIIQKGIFKQPLYDERTASIDKVRSTGNDYGEISPRNMYIQKGNKTLENLIESVEEGVLIDSVEGLHAGINEVTGNISIQSEGYYIKNGHKQYATKLFVLSTNIMDILNNVIEVSNHIEFYLPTTASPDLLVDNIKISK